ncbi:MAG: hypothetical protein J0M20_08525 [Burkholderiales bacterium]|nr:hypothetical protein [Burkholderiales bacterium]
MRRKTLRHWLRRHRRARESGWAALLVLGGSAVAATLLINLGVAMVLDGERTTLVVAQSR